MRRHVSLRQVEAFKAVIEHGTISRAAEIMRLTQPSVSKMIANLETDAGLALFHRNKGRLTPTEQGMRLYGEIDRIFQGVRQIENAIDVIRRDNQEQISVGVLPTLSGLFTQEATTRFLRHHPQTFCVLEARSSQRIIEWLLTRKLDIGLIITGMDFDNPYLVSETFAEHPLVCIMPPGHALAARKRIRPADLHELAFVSFDPETSIGQRITATIGMYPVSLKISIIAKHSATLCEFVAAGHGVSLVHPLMVQGFGARLVVRAFEPAIPFDFKVCRRKDSRFTRLIDDYTDAIRETARALMDKVSSTAE